MGKYNAILDQIVDSIDYIVKDRIKNAPFDRTRTGKIVGILGNNKYRVKIDNAEYDVMSISDEVFSPNAIVKILVPENQYSNMFILAASSNPGGEIVSVVNSVNGQIGDVIIGISDIDGLSEQLSSKLSVNSDLKSNIVSFTENTIREGISSGETLSSMLGKISKWYSDLSDVAFTGDYNDLVNQPDEITNTSQLTNDSNFISDANYVHTDNNYTTAEKDKLKGLTNYTLPLASSDTLGGIKSGGDIFVDSNGNVSVDVANALGYTPLNSALKGTSNGLAELDSNGKIPTSQLPSYVDDVIEGYYNNNKFYKESTYTTEINSEAGKIYVDLSSNKTYRWSGSGYVVISETLALGTTSGTAYRGDYGNTAYLHSQKTSGNPHNVTKSDIGLNNVENKSSETIRSELTKENVTSALGYTPIQSEYTLPVATTSVLGGVKSGTDITIDSNGNVSVNNNSHTHTVSNISDLNATATELNYISGATSNIQTQLNNKSSSSHTHTYTTIPDTRNDNQLPTWYMKNYSKKVITEFKYCSSVGLSGQMYCKVTTYVPWSDSSGGYPVQEAVVGNRLHIRVGISDEEWGSWASVYSTSDKQTLSDFGVTATATELNYVDGVTSNIQTQLNNKANTSTVLTKTNTTAYTPTADYHPATKKFVEDQIIAAGNVYSVNVNVPTSSWVADTSKYGYTHKATVSVDGVTTSNDIIVGLSNTATRSQVDACSEVNMRCIEQGNGFIVLYSTGIPVEAFTISIIICN